MSERKLVRRGNVLPLGEYRTPDGKTEYGYAVPNMLMGFVDAYNALGYAGGLQQDPNAPQGYVSQNALQRGAEGIAGSATLGSFATRAPAGALRAGAARGAASEALDPSQAARMARAREMGFDTETPMYHGTKVGNIEEMRPMGGRPEGQETLNQFRAAMAGERQFPLLRFREGTFFSPDPKVANAYAGEGDLGAVYPTYLRYENPATLTFKNGRKEWSIKDPTKQPDAMLVADGNGNITEASVIDPSQIRSVNAMFDPSKSDSANLLAANSRNSQAAGLAMELARNQGREAPQIRYNPEGFGPAPGSRNIDIDDGGGRGSIRATSGRGYVYGKDGSDPMMWRREE